VAEVEVKEEIRQLAGPLAEEAGYELVDIETGVQGHDRAIRVLLDKPGGITVGECARFSRRLSDCLDMNQTVPGRYRLEVSSPGIDRPLTGLDAVSRYLGHRAGVTLHDTREGRRRFEGVLLGGANGRVGLKDDHEVEHWFDWAEVRSARLVVDPWAEARARRESRDAHPPRGGDR
jgi:ribosome maturation factor RimP